MKKGEFQSDHKFYIPIQRVLPIVEVKWLDTVQVESEDIFSKEEVKQGITYSYGLLVKIYKGKEVKFYRIIFNFTSWNFKSSDFLDIPKESVLSIKQLGSLKILE